MAMSRVSEAAASETDRSSAATLSQGASPVATRSRKRSHCLSSTDKYLSSLAGPSIAIWRWISGARIGATHALMVTRAIRTNVIWYIDVRLIPTRVAAPLSAEAIRFHLGSLTKTDAKAR